MSKCCDKEEVKIWFCFLIVLFCGCKVYWLVYVFLCYVLFLLFLIKFGKFKYFFLVCLVVSFNKMDSFFICVIVLVFFIVVCVIVVWEYGIWNIYIILLCILLKDEILLN